MIDFLILYEHKAREYENVKLLKMVLENIGYSVKIEKTALLSYFRYLLPKNRPKVIVTYSLYNNASLVTLVLSVGWNIKKVVNLQWEQVFTYNPESIALHTPSENAVRGVHVCWGKECQERLKSHGVMNAVLTGAIPLDFAKPAFSLYFKSRAELEDEYSLQKGKMILYISSFTQVGLQDKEIAVLRNKLGDDFIDNLKNGLKTRKITLEWMDVLLEMDPDCYVVYRPHPGENLDDELNRRVKKGRFFVIRDYTVQQWIVAADKIYTWISLSIVEAYFSNKMCYIIRPYPVEKNFDIQLYDGADVIDNIDKLKKSYIDDSFVFPIKSSMINRYYNIDKEYSYMKIVNLLDKVYKTKEYDIKQYPFTLYIKAIIVIIIRMIKRVIIELHITSRTPIITKFRRLSKWLEFFYYYQNKESLEVVSEEEDAEIEQRLEKVLERIEQ